MKILITGNLGYLGPVVVRHLRETIKDAYIVGYDTGYFSHCLTTSDRLADTMCDQQVFGDLRDITREFVSQFDGIVLLAAISNDPMGEKFAEVTDEINHKGCLNVIEKIDDLSSKTIVFASSCSMYGAGGDEPRKETDTLNPLTAYARSKVDVEQALENMAAHKPVITSLRFSTACGMSDRLRLDLVLNDFVASAMLKGEIEVLSDGTPWRPLIAVKDMARAIEWALLRKADNGGHYLAVNVGSDEWTYQIKQLARAVGEIIPDVNVKINSAGQPDKRSYKVDFTSYKKHAPHHQPQCSLEDTVKELVDGIAQISGIPQNFRDSGYVRLSVLNDLIEKKLLNSKLYWN
ncbi:NAD-dependent epimerase/dehydratase [Hoeflea sp. G2-23]|uniref:NAD-dependent epimerase/dehydratase n=1 Tax=Hoeflea algicola TaxID=2983763 RepID=A0ABT3ZBI4_9HYPH|nr:NAD-dependent epimerase/dehydratase [Hoeflea algicola]MCY0149157.1 NAD-dependent epimerase/dehydratase [Hoeflea algicola]